MIVQLSNIDFYACTCINIQKREGKFETDVLLWYNGDRQKMLSVDGSGGERLRVWHSVEDESDKVVIGIDGTEFHLHGRDVADIGQAIYQAYQAGAWHALRFAGYRDDVVEAVFGEIFGNTIFDFAIPLDIRMQEIRDWYQIYDDTDMEEDR